MSPPPGLPPFHYEALGPNDIRLLFPTDTVDGLSWKMRVVRLDDQLEFDALSYVWGSQDKVYPITCNGRALHVHKNLYTALPYLAQRNTYRHTWKHVVIRDPEVSETSNPLRNANESGLDHTDASDTSKWANPRWTWVKTDPESQAQQPLQPIWIDALCINQRDEQEKAVQIAHIGTIYRCASMVWVWLGLVKDHSLIKAAIDVLPTIVGDLRVPPDSKDIEEHAISVRDNFTLPMQQTNPDLWRALHYLLANSWFTRLWIVQEAALANKITFLCGQHVIPYDLLSIAIDNTTSVGDSTDATDRLNAMAGMHRSQIVVQVRLIVETVVVREIELQRTVQQMLALSLRTISLAVCLHQDCLLPQDRVLGLLGLLSPEQHDGLGVDLYSYNSVQQLYTKFTAFVLTQSERPGDEQLNQHWPWLSIATAKKEIDGLPSWVPDLHCQNKTYSAAWRWRSNAPLRACLPIRTTFLREGPVFGTLVTRGRILGVVTEVCTAIPQFPQYPNEEQKIQHLLDLAYWEQEASYIVPEKPEWAEFESTAATLALRNSPRVLAGNLSHNRLGEYDFEAYTELSTALGQIRYELQIFDAYKLLSQEGPSVILENPEERLDELYQAIYNAQAKVRRTSRHLDQQRETRLFRAGCGHWGFATGAPKAGDVVCLLNQAPVWHILRTANHKTEGYELIGDAYVQGLMHGEADRLLLVEQDILLV